MMKTDARGQLARAMTLISEGRLAESLPVLEPLTTGADRTNALQACITLAMVFNNLGRLGEAERWAQSACSMAPADVRPLYLLLGIYDNLGNVAQAYRVAQQIGERPVPLELLGAYCQATVRQADYARFDRLGDVFTLLAQVPPGQLPGYIASLSMRNRVFSADSLTKFLALQSRWGAHMMQEAQAHPLSDATRQIAERQRNRDGRLRIGFYVLSDIAEAQRVLKPIVERLDRSLFEVCLAFIEHGAGVVTDDSFTGLFEQVIVIAQGNNRSVADKLAQMSCDILIDLNGLQAPSTRLGAMAWRVAPLQLSWTGQPNTCGLPALDYMIVDEVLAADGVGCLNATLALPGAFACFGAMPDFPLASTLPSQQNKYATFGVGVDPSKYNLGTVAMWSAILHRSSGAHLAFLRPEYASAPLQSNILEAFGHYGIERGRIEFWCEKAPRREHMKAYNRIDVLLDCYPKTGGIGMLESLHMGVPAVTLEGDAVQLRVGASHLHAVGLDDLRARTTEQYIEKAVALAADTERRALLRATLRQRLAKSAYTDVGQFAAGFNNAMKNLVSHPALADRSRHRKETSSMDNQQTINMDGKEYLLSALSAESKAQLQMYQATEQRIAELQRDLAIMQTARTAYGQALKASLASLG
ncbi:hypothetical protein RugamoR64_15800 [Duganella rhizosphaerae]